MEGDKHIEFQSEAEYRQAREAIDRLEAWRGDRTSYKTEDVPPELRGVTNGMRSAVEVWEFRHNAPERYFLYVRRVDNLASEGEATTWTGQRLGTVKFGRAWRDNFGGQRVSIIVYAINGATYTGTYFKSSGDYARIRMTAKSKRALANSKQEGI